MRRSRLSLPQCALRLVLTISLVAITTVPTAASKLWNWDYTGSGIAASGTFLTLDTPDASGGYLITSIKGARNGERITMLQPPGTSIPGNEPYTVDNLIFPGPGPQMTSGGFGFGTSGGNFSNPFYAGFLPTPGYLEFFSFPPFTAGGPSTFGHTELPIRFTAAPVVTPEPATYVLVLAALALVVLRSHSRRARATS